MSLSEAIQRAQETALTVWDAEIHRLSREIDSSRGEIRRFQSELNRHARDTESKRSLFENMKDTGNDALLAETRRDLERLTSHSLVEAIDVQSGYLYVYTKQMIVWCDYYSKSYRIGRYMLKIPLSGYKEDIRGYTIQYRCMEAKDDYGYLREGPHLGSEGKPCFGNSASTFNELMSARDYIAVAYEFIRYMQSANANRDFWGGQIKYWPEEPKPDRSSVTRHRLELVERLGPKLKHLTPELLDQWLFNMNETQLRTIGSRIDNAIKDGTNWEVEWVIKGRSF